MARLHPLNQHQFLLQTSIIYLHFLCFFHISVKTYSFSHFDQTIYLWLRYQTMSILVCSQIYVHDFIQDFLKELRRQRKILFYGKIFYKLLIFDHIVFRFPKNNKKFYSSWCHMTNCYIITRSVLVWPTYADRKPIYSPHGLSLIHSAIGC